MIFPFSPFYEKQMIVLINPVMDCPMLGNGQMEDGMDLQVQRAGNQLYKPLQGNGSVSYVIVQI
jgi:hypothetical protein